MKRAMQMTKEDNVATAIDRLEADDTARVVLPSQEVAGEINIKQSVQFGHKFAVRTITSGEDVIKYGEVVGKATDDIAAGEYVHIHNVTSNRMQLPEIWYRQ